ncbi:hypothetical protein GFS60_03126 [Rhodococcus sp. WAY2]|nr:hypothetical protein GFS60_03126 [Rhodococcus sp. WAY2]
MTTVVAMSVCIGLADEDRRRHRRLALDCLFITQVAGWS